MSAESPRHVRSGGPLTIPSQPPSDRSIIDAVSGFINDVTLSSSSTVDPKDVIQWARFETADINEPTPEGDGDSDIQPLLLVLGYGSGVQVWLIPPSGEAQEVLSWRQGTVRVLRILPTPQHGDCFASKRPLIALCDSASPGPAFCSLSFISIRGGEQVKSIKFKNPILDVLANKRSVVVSFSERFAVFDAGTLEDRLAVTTCYPCPCPLGGAAPINPIALGDRWLAYADKKLNPSKRSSGGCESEGVTSYTATVLHAAKSLSKGLRGLGESVAHSLSGGRSTSQSPSPPHADAQQPGVVTILDIESNDDEDSQDCEDPCDSMVAHFIAHSEAIIALKFDPSGMLLVTADRRGHDFHVFRINPHPCGPNLASVHHLYVLHRGDTTAKVQDIAISSDGRWAAVSTLRGTAHVFAISAYGGACGVRTHTQPRVVNRLSRFHRSAGLPIHQPHTHSPGDGVGAWFPNPRLPPYPHPTTCAPLAQLRPHNIPTHTITRTSSGRQRLSSVSEDSGAAPLLARVRFGVSGGARPASVPLYLMSAGGVLLHLLLHPRPARGVPKEKICDDSPIEVDVEAVSQWPLQRPPAAADLLAPLPPSNPLLQPLSCRRCADMCMSEEERWLSQVEIVTHAGPHRRLWMGPQFVFKTYNCTGSSSSLSEAESVEVEASTARSTPVNVPAARPRLPVLVGDGSASSVEHSPSDTFRRKSLAEAGRAPVCDVQLREDLAEAMKEDHGAARAASAARAAGGARGDPDRHTRANADEAAFRAVAGAPLGGSPEPRARPLPRTTTIPAQPAPSPQPARAPVIAPRPLTTDVVIPAQLTSVADWLPPDLADDSDDDLSPDGPPRRIELPRHVEPTRYDEPLRHVEPTRYGEAPRHAEPTRYDEPLRRAEPTRREEPPRQVEPTRREEPPRQAEPTRREDPPRQVEPTRREEPPRLAEPTRREDPPRPVEATRREEPPRHVETTRREEPSRHVEPTRREEPPRHIEPMRREESPRRDEPSRDIRNLDRHNLDNKVDVDSERKDDSACARASTRVEAERVDTVLSLPKSSPPATDIQPPARPRVKRSPPTKRVSDVRAASDVSVRRKEVDRESGPEEACKKLETRDASLYECIHRVEKEVAKSMPTKTGDSRRVSAVEKDNAGSKFANASVSVEKVFVAPDIKSEEQAWDMLLTEPQKGKPPVDPPLGVNETKTEDRTKGKKPRRGGNKKSQDDATPKTKHEEDSFVEILTIEEDKQALLSDDLVSISSAMDFPEPTSSYLPRTRKNRSSKSLTPEKRDDDSQQTTENDHQPERKSPQTPRIETDYAVDLKDSQISVAKSEEGPKQLKNKHRLSVDSISDVSCGRSAPCSSNSTKESPKLAKNKSPSPQRDTPESREREVYVINTTAEDDFPEIQITKGKKSRKRSPQPPERNAQEKSTSKLAPKSWSSIAAAKNVKKSDNVESCTSNESDASVQEEKPTVSLQEKLIELCKRSDVMVAECDAPSELNFVEEHHSVLHDLPPLEPLDFGLEDFKLDVMRDSLLDVNETKITSPICKINIDDILSSIKETTARVIESSTYNLIDLEKVKSKKGKGYSVVETDKITSQEVRLDDEAKTGKEVEVEKSSDDDVLTPGMSADVSLSAPLPTKQGKTKKLRKKKK